MLRSYSIYNNVITTLYYTTSSKFICNYYNMNIISLMDFSYTSLRKICEILANICINNIINIIKKIYNIYYVHNKKIGYNIQKSNDNIVEERSH